MHDAFSWVGRLATGHRWAPPPSPTMAREHGPRAMEQLRFSQESG